MIFTVDAGNTTIRFCAVDETKDNVRVCRSERIETPGFIAESDRKSAVKRLLAGWNMDPGDFSGAVICSVVPKITGSLSDCLAKLFKGAALLINSGIDPGLTFKIPYPEKVGADRIADAAWTAANIPLPAVTVDLGTATTFNVIDEGGVFLGGLILPGIGVSLRSLSDSAAQLPDVMAALPESVIGRYTEECMCAGVIYGTASAIDGITARIERELGRPVSLIITGGHAPLIDALCTHRHSFDPDLLPKGLALLYQKNALKAKL